MKLLPFFFVAFVATASWSQGGQSVIIKGALDESDALEGTDHVDIHRIPLTGGDFLAGLLVSAESYPELQYRFHPKGVAPDPTRAWNWCGGSSGLLQGTVPSDFIATPAKGPAVPFKLQPINETLVFSAPEDGTIEMRISCSKPSPYILIIGKERFTPVAEVVAKGTITADDPLFETHSRIKDHVLPAFEKGGFMVEVRLPVDPKSFTRKFILTTPGGSKILTSSSSEPTDPLLAIGRAERGEYGVRVLGISNEGKMKRPMPYELVLWRIPDLFALLGLKPSTE